MISKQLLLPLILLFALLGQTHALSMPIVRVSDSFLVPSTASQTTTLDVSIDGIGLNSVDLAGFQLTLSVIGTEGAIKFLGVGAPETHSYPFSPSSLAPIGRVSDDGFSIELGDFLNQGTVSIQDGDGLASLLLHVPPDALGVYEVRLDVEPSKSFLAESSTEFVEFETRNGQITVVPEPSTAILAILAFVSLVRVHSSARQLPQL